MTPKMAGTTDLFSEQLTHRGITLAFLFAIWKRLERKDWQIYRDTKPGQNLLAYCRKTFLQLDERNHLRKLMDDMGQSELADVLAFIDWITAPGADDARPTLTFTGGSTSILGPLGKPTSSLAPGDKSFSSDDSAFTVGNAAGHPTVATYHSVIFYRFRSYPVPSRPESSGCSIRYQTMFQYA
jgi:hypothetical protein